MQAYRHAFARIYDRRWSGFARQVSPLILDFYAATPAGQRKLPVLDLCCGTGQLALYFLEHGYPVTGLDLSQDMLLHARQNALSFIESGRANFVCRDASDFHIGEGFGLIVSTFDALNHLEDMHGLRRCFACAAAAGVGYFIFDLNTRFGLKRWNSINVDENDEDSLIIIRGIYDEQGDKAWTRVTGFVKMGDNLYERFDETVFNTVFSMQDVRRELLEAGWKDAYFALIQDLRTPIAEPEKEGRIFIVASK